MFDYIDENIEKIKNPYYVNIIIPEAYDGRGKALWARINDGELIQLTKSQGVMTFPWEPIYWLEKEKLGKNYFKNFGVINNQISINKKHLTKLGYVDANKMRISTYAYFDDGEIVLLCQPLRKYFFQKLKPEIEQKFGMEFKDIVQEMKQKNEIKK